MGEGLPGPHNHANFHICGFINVALWPPKSPKIAFFGLKFAPKKKSRGSIEKLEYRCITRNLPLCNGTIIVLKITLLHSVSVITNFVIPKRDRQTKKSQFFACSRRATYDPHHTWRGDRGGPSRFYTPNFFDPNGIVSPLGAIENLKENAPTAGKCL